VAAVLSPFLTRLATANRTIKNTAKTLLQAVAANPLFLK
jgi:hypothetical protein